MKKILKIIGAFLVSVAIGLLIGITIAALFGGKSWSEAFSNVVNSGFRKLLSFILWGVIGSLVAIIVQIIVHEGGHLVAGLLTGYRFVSFRISNLTLIKKNGRFQLRNFSIAGTGGQCLMAPPLRPLSEINTRWYNLGGVLANLILSTIALLILYLFDLPTGVEVMLTLLAIFGYLFALTNGIPMKISGVSNDGFNLFYLEKSPHDKQLLCQMLEVNAQIQNGKQPKELPDDMFVNEEPVDWKDGLQTNWQLLVVARMENLHQWEEAYALLKEAQAHQDNISGLFLNELMVEMVFVCLITGRIDEARALYNKNLRKYVMQYTKTQSSKQRVHVATTLLLDGNREEAFRLFKELKEHRNDYLMQGEVDMDIELMQLVLDVNE